MVARHATMLEHPMAQYWLTQARQKGVETDDFERYMLRVSRLLAASMFATVPTKPQQINTPNAPFTGVRPAGRIALAPVTRAGNGMLRGFRENFPNPYVWHINMYRDEETLLPVKTGSKVPHGGVPKDLWRVIVLDIMLATGGSMAAAIQLIRDLGIPEEQIWVANVLCVQEGLDRVWEDHPNVNIFSVAKDPILREDGFIVPGLGDAGDLLYMVEQAANVARFAA